MIKEPGVLRRIDILLYVLMIVREFCVRLWPSLLSAVVCKETNLTSDIMHVTSEIFCHTCSIVT